MELTAIPGVGEKTASALDHLADPAAAIDRGDVAALARAPGISPKRAARIVRDANAARYDDDEEFLATDRATAIYRDLLELLQARAETEYGRFRLETIYPTCSEERLDELRTRADQALTRDVSTDVREPLGDVEPLREPDDLRVRERCLATADAEQYERASRAVPELSVEIVDDARALGDLGTGYSRVTVIDDAFGGLDLPDNVHVRPDALESPAEVVPERTLAFFARNRASIRAAIDVHRQADIEPPTDLDRLAGFLERIDDDGMPAGDDERDRLRSALDDLDAGVELARSVGDDSLREAIQEQDVTVEGTDLLSLVERGAGADALLQRELRSEYEEAVDRAKDHLADALALQDGELSYLDRIFPEEPTFPLSVDEDAVDRLREDLQAAHDRRAIELKRDLAGALADERDAVEIVVTRALELDVDLAIARFAADFGCSIPTFGGTGIEIENGRSPLLDVPIDEVEPVDYAVADVVLLSGVNSGGKTSLLDLIAATTILAHMGLPVPAEHARLQRFDGLHYHAATQGTLDAGAFEATVEQFAELATEPGDRLVLVDELESITEPGAAAVIVGGILEELYDEATAVFVSHLAGEIRDVTDAAVRVDGIAADGVEDGELIVDRTPIEGHLARSTPELIVEQLATRTSGPTAGVYQRLLEKFDDAGE